MYKVYKWLELINRKQQRIHVENVCYSCIQTGIQEEKTIIVIPNVLPKNGFITIEKPIEEIELIDIIKVYSKINKA